MTKINFREITIEDKDWIKARLAEDNDNSCERSFTTIFLYRRLYKAQMADILGCPEVYLQNYAGECAILDLLFSYWRRGQARCLENYAGAVPAGGHPFASGAYYG